MFGTIKEGFHYIRFFTSFGFFNSSFECNFIHALQVIFFDTQTNEKETKIETKEIIFFQG
jgi:hypothetical protein